MAPPTRLGASEEGLLTPTNPLPRRAGTPARPAPDEAAEREGHAESGRALPVRAGEDTDEAWGELPEGPDDARHLRDKPPHWQ